MSAEHRRVLEELERERARLREREERLTAALVASGTGTFRWNILTNELDWDDALDRLFGLEPGVTARNLDEFVARVHPDDRAAIIAACAACAREGADFRLEFRVLLPGGGERWLLDQGRTFRDADGRPVSMTGACVDITERKRAEAARRATEEQMRDITDHVPVLIAYVDREQRYQFNNRNYQDWFGRSPEELRGRHLREAVGAAVYETVRPKVEAALRGERVSFEWMSPLGHAGPRRLRSDYIPRLDAAGRPDGFYVLVTDFTDRHRIETALARSEERLRIAQEAGQIGTFEWNLLTGEVVVSDEFCRIWGFGPTRSVRVGVFGEHVHPEDAGKLATASERPLEEAVAQAEYRIVRPDTRETRWLMRRGEVIRDHDGRPVRVIGVTYDISDRKAAEEQQRLLMQELAHRVKNTFAMIQAIATQTLRNAGSLEEARQTFGARLVALAGAHDHLIRGNWTSMSIRAVVADALQPHDDGLPGRFTIEGPDLDLGAQAALGLALALHELCTNAAKYGALSVPEGRVAIAWSLRGGADARFRFRWTEGGGPAVAAPSRSGFGSRLIRRGLAASFGGEVHVAFRDSGLSVELDAPARGLGGADQLGGLVEDAA
jgi:PAS domain S-box-containing protein